MSYMYHVRLVFCFTCAGMWRNQATADFVEFLREHNSQRSDRNEGSCLLLGLDIYSMFKSAEEVLAYLDAVSKSTADEARRRYAQLLNFAPEPDKYVSALLQNHIAPQAANVTAVLTKLLAGEKTFSQVVSNGDEFFSAAENSNIVKNGEAYYRNGWMGGSVGWNQRDTGMYETLEHTLQ